MSKDGADTWSGREFETDELEIENYRSPDLLDLEMASLFWPLVAERRLERRSDSRTRAQKFEI